MKPAAEPRRWLWAVLVAFVLLDGAYSGLQHLNMPLDGDLAPIIVAEGCYAPVLSDTFGLGVLSGKRYCGPNRYFVHGPMVWYFRQVPRALQAIVPPVESVYLACALLKTAVQLALIGLLAAFAKGGSNGRWEWLVTAALVTPFFQASGYNLQMGIIETSITYTCFYPLPMAFLLLFLLHFYRRAPTTWAHHCWLLPLSVALPLSGPLVPAVVLLVCPTALVAGWWGEYKRLVGPPFYRRAALALGHLPKATLCYFGLATLLSLWSMYVGSFNSESTEAAVGLADRYPALLRGLASIFTQKLGFPLLTLAIGVQLFLLRKYAAAIDWERAWLVGKWLAAFIVAYLLLLPLGGYRSYRALIVRHDTVLPVTLGLVFFYAYTALLLLRNAWQGRRWHAVGLAALSLAATLADLPEFHRNDCEKAALTAIARSTEPVVQLSANCPVLGWHDVITHPEASRLNARLLRLWQVTTVERLYFSKLGNGN